jgi:hypothetical protein
MELDEFRDRVHRAFGESLHRASPATVRDFLDNLQSDLPRAVTIENPFMLEESANSYEEVMRTFFLRVLDMPSPEAIQMLWAVAFDLSYAIIESHDADRIGHLFRGLEEPTS